MNLAKAGAFALKVYTCHLLVFTAGVTAGGIVVATILMPFLVVP